MLRRASISSPISSPEHQLHMSSQHMPHGVYMQPQLLPQGSPGPEVYHQHQHQHQPHPHHAHTSGRHAHHKGKRVLPMTPNEEPYQHSPPDVPRPHSRAESAPDHPLPVPWRPSLAPHSQLVVPLPLSPTSPVPGTSPTDDFRTHPAFKEPLISPLTQQQQQPQLQPPQARGHHKSAGKKKLSPLRPKSMSIGSMAIPGNLSKSIDGLNLKPAHGQAAASHTVSGVSWQQHQKVGPVRGKRNSEGALQGWGSFQRLGQPADIQAFMRSGHGMPAAGSFNTLPYNRRKLDLGGGGGGGGGSLAGMNQDAGSTTSVEIRQEMFAPAAPQPPPPPLQQSPSTSPLGSKGSSPLGPSPQASNSQFRSPADGQQSVSAGKRKMQHPLPPHHAHKSRSYSAKPAKRGAEPYHMGNHTPEHSTSMKYVGAEQRHHTLPNLDDGKVLFQKFL